MKAKIERVNEWSSRKGFFFTAAGQDYYGNGKSILQTGATYTFDVNPEKTLGDAGAQLATNFKVAQDADAPTGRPANAGIAGAGAPTYTDWKKPEQNTAGNGLDKDEQIARAVALKAAADQSRLAHDSALGWAELEQRTLGLAEQYLAWLKKVGA